MYVKGRNTESLWLQLQGFVTIQEKGGVKLYSIFDLNVTESIHVYQGKDMMCTHSLFDFVFAVERGGPKRLTMSPRGVSDGWDLDLCWHVSGRRVHTPTPVITRKANKLICKLTHVC